MTNLKSKLPDLADFEAARIDKVRFEVDADANEYELAAFLTNVRTVQADFRAGDTLLARYDSADGFIEYTIVFLRDVSESQRIDFNAHGIMVHGVSEGGGLLTDYSYQTYDADGDPFSMPITDAMGDQRDSQRWDGGGAEGRSADGESGESGSGDAAGESANDA